MKPKAFFPGMAILAFCCGLAWAEEPVSHERLFDDGVRALQQGDHNRAITIFETLADRGFVHPDVAYNRGMAYLARIRAKQGRPGDLGRAAAGFEEASLVRPDDEQAIHAAERVRAEVARTTARSGRSQVVVSPSLDRILAGLAPEAVWAWLALVASLTLSTGLVLRQRKASAAHLAGTIATPIGLMALMVFASLAGWSRHIRRSTAPAVVVVAEARIVDEQGTALPKEEPIPEASRVEVLERRAGLSKIRYGQREGWTHTTSLRELARPRAE
ncbi:MAG TPA: hypothetical protein PKL73_09730 [Polyangiaceae bacterium]|jgi:hypothetical protein|nr:MAG: hypothetical protein BWY17_02403 [Deltaproteobacteria bacterium ADurb.Bin207]HNS97216.1 hypothetical protein [Polyangiaceae bacterium]HNZ21109.1 hypothetical protein [Polyangiaceae bacterium]HOD24721.1 hypothetical protein [Polyangiaceae bacterium]HOE47879.1 hypothetical protein [Polyangiaceae bacterium]